MSDAKRKKTVAVSAPQYEVGFMYDAPPGLREGQTEAQEQTDTTNYKQAIEQQKNYQYPFLATAPLEGAYVKSQEHSINPIGIVLRNVKCAKCGLYGHRSNEKVCPMIGVVTEADKQQVEAEDPLQKIKKGLIDNKFALRSFEDSVIGGLKGEDPNLQLIESDKSDSSSSESEDEMQQAFLESLSKSQMKALLKEYKRAARKKKKKEKKKASKGEKKDKDKKSTKKKHKKEKRSPSSERESSKKQRGS